MMRVNLLRPLGANADESASPPPPAPREDGPAWKPVLFVLLLLLVAGVLAVGYVKPKWLNLERISKLWERPAPDTDALARAQAAAEHASRLVDARQEAAIEWLYQLELLMPTPDANIPKAPVVPTLATFTAAGDFLLSGTAASAEALSALQETLVLVPGLDLRESRAEEVAGSAGPAFTFRFTGRLEPTGDDTSAGTAEPVAAVRNRVVDSIAITAHLDTLLNTAKAKGFTLASPRAATPAPSGAFTAHGWRLKAVYAAGQEASFFTAIREVLELERHRGSPFAVQRITLEKQGARKTVFLDILALTP